MGDPDCPGGGRAKCSPTPTPPLSCLRRYFRVRADSINGQTAADPEAGPSESAGASPLPGPGQVPPPPILGRQRGRAAGPRMRSSNLWPGEGRSRGQDIGNLHFRILAPPPSCWCKPRQSASPLCASYRPHHIWLL